jgi:heat shock protein HslJ
MRGLRVAALMMVLPLLATAAEAQSRRRGGGEEQRPPQGERPPTKEEKRFPLGAQWIAVSLNGKRFTGSERPNLLLNDQFRATGFGGCNAFSATAFPLREQGIAVGPLALTKRTCAKEVMASEREFLVALRTSQKWDTVQSFLVLKSPNGELRFERSL